MAQSDASGYEVVERCYDEGHAFIGAKHGNAVGQFYCNIHLKGREFPVLSYSWCSVNADNEFKYNRMYELTDINAFEPSTFEQGLVGMLDEHVRRLSAIFVLADKCD